MKILVTGGAGFLGRHLCRKLNELGHQITIIDLKQNPDFQTIIADVRDKQKMLEMVRDVDAVFHLASLIEAGESVEQPQKYVDFNISATINILEAMRINKINTFIFSSSAAIYGEPIKTPIEEDDRTIPINPYGMTKLAMEGLLSSYVKSFGLTGIALRYFNLYGPEEHHEPETHAIPRFIKQIFNGEEVTFWGDGLYQRDFVHIRDIVDAHIKALELANNQPNQYHYMNLSAESPATVKEVAEIIGEIMKKAPNIKYFPERPGDPRVLIANASKAKNLLGWQAKVSLRDGLEETVKYFLKIWD